MKGADMSDREVAFTPAHELAARIARKEISSVELTQLYLRRIDELNPKLNAYLTVAGDEAMAAAEAADRAVSRGEKVGALNGLPISVKDMEATAGIRTTFGSLILKDNVPDHDSGAVKRTRESGAVILGKTNTPEFAQRGTTENRLGDPCRNPWDTARSAGGSSGGAGSALAAGLCPIAIASDGGGSLRNPSSYCGVYGIKPTTGRIPRYGGVSRIVQGISSQVGTMGRTVRDAAMLLQALAGPDDRDPISIREEPLDYLANLDAGVKGLRIAWSPDLGYARIAPEVLDLASKAALVFGEMGADLDEPQIRLAENPMRLFRTTSSANSYASYGHYLEERPEDLTDYVKEALERGRRITGAEYALAQSNIERLRFEMESLMRNYDLLLIPTMAAPAPLIGEPVDPEMPANPMNSVFNMTRQPAANVPCGFTHDGLPIGLEIIGRSGDEVAVLRASAAFEQARPWADRLPTVS